MKTLFKKTSCFLLAFVLCASALLVNVKPETVSAATQYDTLYQSSSSETATANVTKSTGFTVKNAGKVLIDVVTGTRTTFTMAVTDASGTIIDSENVTPSSYGWYEYSSGIYAYANDWNLSKGSYNYELTFTEDTTYLLDIYQEAVKPTISNSSIDLTVGFTKTLKVSNTSGKKVTWASNKKTVATVNSKGVVTAKKKGSATITAKVNGTTLKCKVKVYNNIYSDTKLTNSGFKYGDCYVYAYQAKFDSKGNINLKVRVVNNSGYTVSKLTGLKFYVKAANKKTIATYSLGTKNMTVYNNAYKDFAVTIPKAKIKKTKTAIDLRNLYDVQIKGSYYYRY